MKHKTYKLHKIIQDVILHKAYGTVIRRKSTPKEVTISIERDPTAKSIDDGTFFKQHVKGINHTMLASISPEDIVAKDWLVVSVPKGK